ncbi:MAG: glutamate racemase [Candidatus Shapirobacteria bacterium]|nr:glutamate racemase [Candidatus Shapirobacteria bacterium]MDD5073635.1 glutamate racemase [Candidatus Shapirobacteria bacterium]MDD5481404.1 glutamate racemase [Candidatus Shapirobacteria bacterium]
MKIGVFDSGLGGLSILKSLKKSLPQYDYLYLGDSLHVPYGDKDPEKITTWAKKIIPFFIEKNCCLIIFACNTITATSLSQIQEKFDHQIKVLGIIRPTSEFLLANPARKIGIIGTTNTIVSNIFTHDLEKISPKKRINYHQQACPGLVEEIEKGPPYSKKMKTILSSCLALLTEKKVDVLVLGCTHYNLIADQIQTLLPKTKIITQGDIAAQKLAAYLNRHLDLAQKITCQSKLELYFTKIKVNYSFLVNFFLDNREQSVELKLAKINFS